MYDKAKATHHLHVEPRQCLSPPFCLFLLFPLTATSVSLFLPTSHPPFKPRHALTSSYLSACLPLPSYQPLCLSVGQGSLRRLSYCPGWGKSIDFLMCSFLFSSQTVFDIVCLFKKREQSLFLCLQWSWSFRTRWYRKPSESEICFFDLLMFLLH